MASVAKSFPAAVRSQKEVRVSSSGRPMRLNLHNKPEKSQVLVRSQPRIPERQCDVFINHRGPDTKKNVAGLLHDYLQLFRYHPFLDAKTMKPGEKLPDRINQAIRQCKVGIAVFSPHYCKSIHCLDELALLLETGKRLLPIFVDIEPSELSAEDCSQGKHPSGEQYGLALEEARTTVGLTFDSSSGDWPKLMRDVVAAVEWNFSDLIKETPPGDKESVGWMSFFPPSYSHPI